MVKDAPRDGDQKGLCLASELQNLEKSQSSHLESGPRTVVKTLRSVSGRSRPRHVTPSSLSRASSRCENQASGSTCDESSAHAHGSPSL